MNRSACLIYFSVLLGIKIRNRTLHALCSRLFGRDVKLRSSNYFELQNLPFRPRIYDASG